MKYSIHIVLFLSILIASCTSQSEQKEKESSESQNVNSDSPELFLDDEVKEGETIEKNGIKLTTLSSGKEFDEAALRMIEASSAAIKAGDVHFEFELDQFDLAVQTHDNRSQQFANSEKGQHIHFILNNGPYSAHYSSSFEKELAEGNNVILAFLSRSYHESVKNQNAFVFKNIAIGEDIPAFNEKAPHLIYSRPKGSYKGSIDKILLDFYLLNAQLSEKGMKVKVNIDNTEFLLHSWKPYMVEGLVEGEHQFRIQLIDSLGKVVPGPFNDSGERTIVLES